MQPAEERPPDRRANKGRNHDSSPIERQRTAVSKFVASDGDEMMGTMPVAAEQKFTIARCLGQNQRPSRQVARIEFGPETLKGFAHLPDVAKRAKRGRTGTPIGRLQTTTLFVAVCAHRGEGFEFGCRSDGGCGRIAAEAVALLVRRS